MRLSKLLVCSLLICALALPMTLAESEEPVVTEAPTEKPTETPTQKPTEAPTEKPTEAPTQKPTESPTEKPTETPTQEPTEEPTQAPTEAPTEGPTEEPTQVPTEKPTETPTQSPTNEPTQDPTEEPTEAPTEAPSEQPTDSPTQEPEPSVTTDPTISPEPTITPDPTFTPPTAPGIPGELVAITCEGNAKLSDGVWEITPNASNASIGFSWTVDGTAEMFYLFMDFDYLGETTEYRTNVSLQAYMDGQHTLYVGALLDDGSITWGAVNFRIASGGKPNGGFPGGRPSGDGRPSGNSAAAGVAAEEQGFHITPGKALTSKHSSGTKNTAAYTCSEIIDSEEVITALVLESTQTEIMLDGGAAFFVSNDDGKLQLTPESDGVCWNLNVLAMNTLAENGIDRVVFHVGSTAYSITTRMEFSGSIYSSLRAKGYVSKDMEICVNAQGLRVYIAGGAYSINDSGELIPCEE